MGFHTNEDLIFIFIAILFFILNIVITTIYSSKKKKKLLSINENGQTISIDDIVKNNQFIMNNREKYENIMNQNASNLQFERRRARFFYIKGFVILLVILILLYIFKNKINFWHVIMAIVCFIGISAIGAKGINQYLHNDTVNFVNVVKSILKEYDSNLEYYPADGFKSEEYDSLCFMECCDKFYSDDLIVNSQIGFSYADILVQSTEEDDDGHTHEVIQFDGTLAKMNISNVHCKIVLGGIDENTVFGDGSYKNIKFENDEFNKLFACFTDNELNAYKVLTPDVMEEIVNIKGNSLGDIDIRIFNDKLYIRFKGTDGFDSTIFNKEVEKANLFKSIAILDQIIKTMNNVKTIIDNKNIN